MAESSRDLRSHVPGDPGLCPYTVERVAMWHRWDQLTFLHWPFEPDLVQSLLPPGLTVETYEERAWVGLVPFIMEVRRTSSGRLLRWPFLFPETNVRTYVTGPDGIPGVWFLSLESSRLGAVPAARSTYRVRYFWSQMSVSRGEHSMLYSARRRWPGKRGAQSETRVSIGSRYEPSDLGAFDHFLTARWVMYGSWGNKLLMAYAVHEPWELFRATADCSDELVAAAGLPQPIEQPIVHWSPGVDVAIGYPHRIQG